jgi:ribosomal protein S18 acetylase RimI-like enzyme
MHVKDAKLDDLDALIALNAQAQKLHAELEPSHFRAATDEAEIRAFFADALATPNNHVLLAFDDARPMGYLWFEFQHRPGTPFTHPRRRVYLHHIAVDKAARRRGMASALLSKMEEKALSQGFSRIVLDAWAANRDAQDFFRTKGYSPFNVVLGKSLDPAV